MDLSTKLHRLDLHSSFFPSLRPSFTRGSFSLASPKCLKFRPAKITSQVSTVSVETSVNDPQNDIESLFSSDTVEEIDRKRGNRKSNTGASDVSWEVKKGEKVGLVEVNGAGKMTQMRIIVGLEEPDSGNVIKAKPHMKVAFLNQEFKVLMTRTVREEFMSSFKEEMEISKRRAQAVDLDEVDAKVSKLMPELGFSPEDSDKLVGSFSSGWQMRMSLGKILLQKPDLLLLDEPTNHLDLDTIEWLERYLNKQDVPMVIISHDRAFLDQLCTKIVETDMGVSRTFEGIYSQYVEANASWVKSQYAAWEKHQKEIEQTKDLISRLGVGANSGRASSAEKVLLRRINS
ncbi:ABC transporter F family member 5 [Hibiscus syriacus]|uniref:ABC transporter F family member 5 n=1 Tax=Hibiscus syriacus TaxID=106335 RepID=A0A6A3C701_HIBSY|nr:ABC transporter F family member 5 [Hibiscus syriacus]